MTGLGPRMLQVLQFANARAPELQALEELSQQPAVSSITDAKLETQKKQRRRRANAFKSYQMPQRLRTVTSNNPSTLRCRKHRRRPHQLRQARSAGTDSKQPRWLATHLWHAKRMVMRDQYGYMVPHHRVDKSVSASLQAVRKKATLHDCSYLGIIELFGLPQRILEALQLVSDPNGSDFHGFKFLSGTEEGTSMLYHMGHFPAGTIAPVTFMWRPLKKEYLQGTFYLHEDWQTTKRQLWLWVHPAAYMEAATAIAEACEHVLGEDDECIEMHDRRGQLCRFKLRGRLANELVATLARGNVKADKEEEVDDACVSDQEDGFATREIVATCTSVNRCTLLRTLGTIGKTNAFDARKDQIYAVAISDPRLARYRDGTGRQVAPRLEADLSLLKEPPSGIVPKVGTSVIKSPLSGLSLSSLGQAAEEPETEVIVKELQSLMAWTTNALDNRNHPCYPIVSGEELRNEVEGQDDGGLKASPGSMLWSLSKRRHLERSFVPDHTLNHEIYRQRKAGNDLEGGTAVPLDLLAIQKHEPYPHTSGWDLICLPSYAPCLLKALVFRGAFVVGEKEESALSTVLHQPSFPRDYPDTKAGQVFWDTYAQDMATKQAKKPKAKRLNYEKHNVQAPYQPRWELVFAKEERLQALCVLRGRNDMVPFCFAHSKANNGKDTSDETPAGVQMASIVSTRPSTLVRVVLRLPRRGNIDVNAMLLAPLANDVDDFANNPKWMGHEIVATNKSKGETNTTHERALIGFVTSAIYDRPKSAFRAIGFIAWGPLNHLFGTNQCTNSTRQGHYALAMLHSPQSRIIRPVLVHAEA